jgi:hypothetical protein
MGPEDEELFAGPSLALYSFEPENSNELRLVEGQEIMVSYRHGQGWLVASDPRTGEQGLVPEAYVRLIADMPNYDPETGQFVDMDEDEMQDSDMNQDSDTNQRFVMNQGLEMNNDSEMDHDGAAPKTKQQKQNDEPPMINLDDALLPRDYSEEANLDTSLEGFNTRRLERIAARGHD